MQETTSVPGFAMVSSEEEQAWNQDQLQQTVSRPLVRLWSYREPSLILGCSQRSAVAAQEVEQRAGMGVVVRQAGGGAVLAGPWMLSASIVLPNTHALVSNNLIDSYRWIGQLHEKVLQGLGIDAHAIGPEEARLQQAAVTPGIEWACFGGFSPWEVVVGKRKIVGLAQVRRRTGTLIVAGVLVSRPEWPRLSLAMNQEAGCNAALVETTTSCSEQLGRTLSIDEVALPLARALDAAL